MCLSLLLCHNQIPNSWHLLQKSSSVVPPTSKSVGSVESRCLECRSDQLSVIFRRRKYKVEAIYLLRKSRRQPAAQKKRGRSTYLYLSEGLFTKWFVLHRWNTCDHLVEVQSKYSWGKTVPTKRDDEAGISGLYKRQSKPCYCYIPWILGKYWAHHIGDWV